ncbi:MAG: DNA polymerase III subunit gamma/tau [Deltaproteobacteria bacterium]|nr:DNA polymerase III subunit gamma/tau [Deltaproteobacteria bacterium]
MSYQVLARKWRPQSFDEVAGQSHVTTALRNAIRTGRVPHALLLTGPRGVGKTTLARLLARGLNCEKGPTDTPCGECASCREISSGASTDVQEIDAASHTGVDDVRDLIEAIRYAPSPGKHRIFVVDEVHMLSTPAFNALLKTLEEPPPRSLFVFATTNPEKIPFTVVSRCQRHDLRRLPTEEIATRLREIAASEHVAISASSLLAVARAGDGSLRDALTLLDQIIAAGGTEVDDARVAAVLDLVDRRLLVSILEACVDGQPARALEACGRAAESGIDARRLGAELLQNLRDLVVLRVAPEANGLVEAADADLEQMRALAARAEEPRLRRMFRALLREQEDLAWAPQAFTVLEMALVRLATLPAGDDVATLLARLDALERRLSGEPGPGPTRSGSGGGDGGDGESVRPGRFERPPLPRSPSRRADTARACDTALGPQAPPAAPVGLVDAGADESLSGMEPPDEAAHPTLENVDDPALPSAPPSLVMDRLRGFARTTNPGLAAPLAGGEILERGPGRLRIGVPGGFAATRLQAKLAALEEICSGFFGERLRVEVVQLAIAGESGQGRGASDDLARRRRQEALQHPAVNAAREILGAEIVEIRPLGAPR